MLWTLVPLLPGSLYPYLPCPYYRQVSLWPYLLCPCYYYYYYYYYYHRQVSLCPYRDYPYALIVLIIAKYPYALVLIAMCPYRQVSLCPCALIAMCPYRYVQACPCVLKLP